MPEDRESPIPARPKLATAVKWALGLVAAALVAPFIFLAVKGIVGLALAVLVWYVIVQFAPVISFKIANLRMKALMGEAAANPIETMKNLFKEKSEELEQAERNIVDFEAEIGNFDDEVRTFKRRYPDEAPRYQEISDKMHAGLAEMKQEQEEARRKLEDFQARIQKAEAIYAMSLAAERVTKFSKSAEARVFADIKEKVAFDSVNRELNRSFAQLNMALSKRMERPVLQLSKGATA